MRKCIGSIVAALIVLVPAMTHGSSIDHRSLARSGTCLSESSGKQIVSSLGQTFPSQAVSQLPTNSKYAVSDLSGSEAADLLSGDGGIIGLRAIYPNPFSPATTIAYAVNEQTHVSLQIYDVSGRLVRTLVDETKAAGLVHTVIWNGTNDLGEALPSGIYFCQLVTKKLTQTRKLVLLN